MTLTGGCLCGAVRYEITGALMAGRSCHCSRCRKAFSGAGSAYAEVDPATFTWVAGEDKLARYESGPGWGLRFCGVCGTTLCGDAGGSIHGVTLGSVDGDPGVEIEQHLFVGSKAPWDHIGGDAPQYQEFPPGSGGCEHLTSFHQSPRVGVECGPAMHDAPIVPDDDVRNAPALTPGMFG